MKSRLKNKVDSIIPEFEEKKAFVGDSPASAEEQENFKAITEEGDVQAVHVPTKEYTLVQIRDVFKDVLEELPENIEGRVNYYSGRGSMTIFPKDEDVGVRVFNSVDGTSALKADFVNKAKLNGEETTVYIPSSVKGYKRVHRGDVESEFENFMNTINEVREIWTQIVDDLSEKEVEEEDIETLKDILGKRGSKKLNEYMEKKYATTLDDYRKDSMPEGWRPDVWELILKSIKIVSGRSYKSDVNKEQRLKRLSANIFAEALKS